MQFWIVLSLFLKLGEELGSHFVKIALIKQKWIQ